MQPCKKARLLDLDEANEPRVFELDSGRQIRVRATSEEELLEVVEPEGEAVLSVRLTAEGPVVSVSGARLELRGTRSLTLTGPRVAIRAEEEAVLESHGRMTVASDEKMTIRSSSDLQVVGKTIYLN